MLALLQSLSLIPQMRWGRNPNLFSTNNCLICSLSCSKNFRLAWSGINFLSCSFKSPIWTSSFYYPWGLSISNILQLLLYSDLIKCSFFLIIRIHVLNCLHLVISFFFTLFLLLTLPCALFQLCWSPLSKRFRWQPSIRNYLACIELFRSIVPTRLRTFCLTLKWVKLLLEISKRKSFAHYLEL
jgi:hypothetical protein